MFSQNMLGQYVAAQSWGARRRLTFRGFEGFGALGTVAAGSTVRATIRAAFTYTLDPFAQPSAALRNRLQASGLNVITLDTSALSVLDAAAGGGWGDLIVVVTTTSDYGTAQDIAGLIAGAADAAGFRVDYNRVIGEALSQAQTDAVKQTSPGGQQGFCDEVAGNLGISCFTLGAGVAAVVLIAMVLKR